MKNNRKLCDLKVGEASFVKENLADEGIKRRLLDIGLSENTYVECVGKSPLGDPCAYLIRGAVIAIRREDSAKVRIY